MLKQSQGNMIIFHELPVDAHPGLAIFVTVIAYNVLGDVHVILWILKCKR